MQSHVGAERQLRRNQIQICQICQIAFAAAKAVYCLRYVIFAQFQDTSGGELMGYPVIDMETCISMGNDMGRYVIYKEPIS